MGEGEDVLRSLLQYCILLVLIVIASIPLILIVSRSATCRMHLRALGCSTTSCSLSACFAGCCSPRVHYDEHDLRTLQELEEPARPVGITGAYRMYQARRARMSLRLVSWHEDVKKCGGRDDMHHKLQQLHAQAQAFESRSTDGNNSSSNNASYPPSQASQTSQSAGLPFDIRIVEINDRVNEDTSSERSYDAYAAMPETPPARAVSSHRRVLELRLQDDDEEKADDAIHAIV